MENPTPKKVSRRRRKAAPEKQAPEAKTPNESAFEQRMNDFQFEVLDVKASPIVEPAPQPTPIPPEDKLLKPWEIVRPTLPNDGQTWQRGQKWRP